MILQDKQKRRRFGAKREAVKHIYEKLSKERLEKTRMHIKWQKYEDKWKPVTIAQIKYLETGAMQEYGLLFGQVSNINTLSEKS